jgi:hypothetical protein
MIPTRSGREVSTAGDRRVVWDKDKQGFVDRNSLGSLMRFKNSSSENRETVENYYLKGLEELRVVTGCQPSEYIQPARIFQVIVAGTDIEPHQHYEEGRELNCAHIAQVAKEFQKLQESGVTHEVCDVITTIAEGEWNRLPEGSHNLQDAEMARLHGKLMKVPVDIHDTVPTSERITPAEKAAVLSIARFMVQESSQRAALT